MTPLHRWAARWYERNGQLADARCCGTHRACCGPLKIASELDISIHTVKTHFKNVYRKLATTRRGEASAEPASSS